jgi:uncharacterized protein (TIGR02466 family)
MNNAEIRTWFPKSVYKAWDVVTSQELADLETAVKYAQANEPGDTRNDQTAVMTHQTYNRLHLLAQYQTLKDVIELHANKFNQSLGYVKVKPLKISSMWANVTGPGDFIFPHTHANSHISGVFYVRVHEGAQIMFFDNLYQMSAEADEPNELSYYRCWYDCVANGLLMFRSDFMHSTPKQLEGEKIAISFNLTWA